MSKFYITNNLFWQCLQKQIHLLKNYNNNLFHWERVKDFTHKDVAFWLLCNRQNVTKGEIAHK